MRPRVRVNQRKSIALIIFEAPIRKTLSQKMKKFGIKFQHSSDNFLEKKSKVGSRTQRIFISDFWTRIIIFLRPRVRGGTQATMPKLYGYKSRQKRSRVQSRVCLCLAYQKTPVRRQSATDGKGVRKRMNGCTDERTNGRFKERPRSSSLFAKIALSAGKILLSQRTTVNHRCESTKARLPAERKEGPITIDRLAKRIETRGIDAAGGPRRRDKEGETRVRRRMLLHAKDALWDYDVNGRFKVCHA